MALFFIFGGITSLNDVIIPKLKELFTLNYTQAMLIQFCFFTAYLVIGIPGAQLVKKIGYMRGAVVGLLTMMVGCLLFIPASATATYGLFLLALFVLASGVVVVQVVSNPLISLLGPAKTVHSRLTFAQAFNSLGTTIFPRVGSALILGGLAGVSAAQLSGVALDQYRTEETRAIVSTYIGLAVALAVIAAVVWAFRNKLPGEKHDHSSPLAGFSLLKRTRFGFGALCIFLYVGGEGLDRIADRQLSDAAGCAWDDRRSRRQDDHVLLGRRDGRPLHRLILPARDEPGQDPGDPGHWRDPAARDLGQHHRHDVGLQPARDRPDELDHVPDHLQPRLREAGAARGGRVGHHQHRHLRRRGGAGADRACWRTSPEASISRCCCRRSAMRSSARSASMRAVPPRGR